MSAFRKVTDSLSVSPQIALGDMAVAAAEGFRLVINNRPDGEDAGQPTSVEMAAAAQAVGLAYAHIPVRGMPTPDQVARERAVMETYPGPTLAFCRSGTRSIIIWSLGEVIEGDYSRDELIVLGTQAGYDLSGVLVA